MLSLQPTNYSRFFFLMKKSSHIRNKITFPFAIVPDRTWMKRPVNILREHRSESCKLTANWSVFQICDTGTRLRRPWTIIQLPYHFDCDVSTSPFTLAVFTLNRSFNLCRLTPSHGVFFFFFLNYKFKIGTLLIKLWVTF